MIRFSLRCENAHEFESWFKDGAAHDRIAQYIADNPANWPKDRFQGAQ